MLAERGAGQVDSLPGSWSAQVVVLSTGFFGLVAQTLLFREFLTVFEGNELGIAWFFATWLVWVAAGAFMAQKLGTLSSRMVRRFEFLPLLYVPAYLLQSGLMGNARALAGVQAFELFPLARMLPVAFLANAPLSICTGLLFPLACRWLAENQRMPVARVYVLESLGSAAGGGMVTLLLSHGAAPESLFLGAALMLSAATYAFRCLLRLPAGSIRPWPPVIFRRTVRWSLIPVAGLALLLATGADRRWSEANAHRAWNRVMPARDFLGSFTTPQARYLYGRSMGQFDVVAWQSVADTIPDVERSSEILATHLAQCPTAQRFLIIGPGSFPLCSRLLSLEQAESVTWLDSDLQYPPELLAALPGDLKVDTDRLDMPGVDVRHHLMKTPDLYDVMIVNLPDLTTLALNRYCTMEFFTLLETRLSAGGIVGVKTPGAENFMGSALANTGAAVYHTLRSVFPHTAMRAGTETWLIASQTNTLSTSPAELRDRFAGVSGAKDLYPPEAVMSLYVPDRITFQTRIYEQALEEHGADMLLNTDSRPKALLYSLLFAASQAGVDVSIARGVAGFARAGVLVFPVAIMIYLVVRLLFRIDNHRRGGNERTGVFDHYMLLASAGALGMGMNLALMFMYQSAFGTVFLHVGLISALFMLGLSAGGFTAERLLAARPGLWRTVLTVCCTCHLLFIILVCVLLAESSRAVFGLAFFTAGTLSGSYVSAAAARLKELGIGLLPSGAAVEMSDHIGGAIGGVVVGLLLIPAFGSAAALSTIALLLLVNLVPALRVSERRSGGVDDDLFRRIGRPVGYAMSGIAAFTVLASLLLTHGRGRDTMSAFLETVRAMAGDVELTEAGHQAGDSRPLTCFSSATTDDGTIYFVCSDRSAPDIYGYGGPITVAAMLDHQGTILDFGLLMSDETPAYVDSLRPWFGQLTGHRIHALEAVDSVTGATLTSEAVLVALRRTGRAFGAAVLGLEGAGTVAAQGATKWPRYLMFVVFAGLALVLRRRPRPRIRQVFLLAVVVVLGVWLNLQYSLASVFSLIGLRLPAPGMNAAFILVAIVPLMVLAFGNIYCGYLCPFGALQELVGGLFHAPRGATPDRTTWRYGRAAKFVILFLCIVGFAPALRQAAASPDPLITAFSRTASGPVGLTFALIALSSVFRRFWCRNLCPTGAFLSILGRAPLIRRAAPRVAVELCDLGVQSENDYDCICCDRCRCGYPSPPGPVGRRPVFNALFLVCVALVGLFFLHAFFQNCSVPLDTGRSANALLSGGKPRDVDMRRLRGMIDTGRLSGKEALHYGRAEWPQASED